MVCEIVYDCLQRIYTHKVSLNTSFNPFRKAICLRKDDTFKGTIDDEDPKKNIICRCEKVTEAEIVDAIQRPLGLFFCESE